MFEIFQQHLRRSRIVRGTTNQPSGKYFIGIKEAAPRPSEIHRGGTTNKASRLPTAENTVFWRLPARSVHNRHQGLNAFSLRQGQISPRISKDHRFSRFNHRHRPPTTFTIALRTGIDARIPARAPGIASINGHQILRKTGIAGMAVIRLPFW